MTNKTIKPIGIIELVIGISTFISISTFKLMSISEKPLNIFIFVIYFFNRTHSRNIFVGEK